MKTIFRLIHITSILIIDYLFNWKVALIFVLGIMLGGVEVMLTEDDK